MRIDSHQHFWKVSRGDYHWLHPGMTLLYRDYLPEDLRPVLLRAGIEKTILVQAAATTGESDFLLDLARGCDFVAGVVGWLDLESPDFPAQFEYYREQAKFAGIRPMLQEIADDGWILGPAVIASLRLVAAADFPIDLLTYPRHLPHVLKALEKVPGLRAVINHISKPEIEAGKTEPWKSLMRKMARHPDVCCKLSGMVTEAHHAHWTIPDLRPYVEHVAECFGWDRVMFGSDWPVCLMAASYDRVLAALRTILAPGLDAVSEAKVFGGNAARFYRLPDAG